MSGESSGEEGALQIDVGEPEEAPKGGKTKRERVVWRPGDVVWAKVLGFHFWPAKVLDPQDPIIPEWLRTPPKPTYILARFFGTYDIQWVSGYTSQSYENGVKKKFPTKSKGKAFQKAVKETKAFLENGVVPEGLTAPPPEHGNSGGTKGGTHESSEEVEDTPTGGSRQALRGSKRKCTGKEGTVPKAADFVPRSSKKARLGSNDRHSGEEGETPSTPGRKKRAARRCNEVIQDLRQVSPTIEDSKEVLENST